jgi:hypothetical protein
LKRGAIPFLLLLAYPLFVSFQQTAAAGNVCTHCWFSVGQPGIAQFGAYRAFEITWVNNGFTTNVTGIVILVVHNYLGQTVEVSTDVLQLGVGATGTAYPVAFGLVSGTYFATFFAVSSSGVSISTTTTASFTV